MNDPILAHPFQLIDCVRKHGIDDVRLALHLISDLGPVDALKEATNDPGLIQTILTISAFTKTDAMIDAIAFIDEITGLQTS